MERLGVLQPIPRQQRHCLLRGAVPDLQVHAKMADPGFATIDEARTWVQNVVCWYNTEHRHSAIRYVMPERRHRGEDRVLLPERDRVYQLARAAHPERWSGRTRNWQPIGSVWLNPGRPGDRCGGHASAGALPHEAGGGGPMAGPVEHAA
ncbi:hypothetical protein [Rhodobacter sp. NSM]|uniref:hypothetical protein n=1 Tax=Rhodobacter sp. NSM TaxID=3457501 RepID=UPI003FD46C5C